MTTALVPVDDLVSLAEKLAPSALLPEKLRGKIPDVLAIIMAGRELGLAPMASLRCLNVIDGKPVLNADGMAAVVRGSGKCLKLDLVESTDKIATFETQRAGGAVQRLSFTIEEAKTAGLLGKDNWKKYPAAMLRARAKAALLRLVYEDTLMGIYTPDEVQDFARARDIDAGPVDDAVDADVVEIDELNWQLRISAATSTDELLAMRSEFVALPNCSAKARIGDLISTRRSALVRDYADSMTKEQADVG